MIFYLLLGLLAFALVGWLKRKNLLNRPTWRLGAGALSIATFSAALYCGLRGLWVPAIVLGVVGCWCAVSARHPRPATRSAPSAPQRTMSLGEARSILGVGDDATAVEIKAAYKRLMQRVHPDAGGAAGLATQLNIARDRLLKP